MSDVFISYARSADSEARRIAEALAALGYGVWRDDQLPAHRDYAEVIEERLRAARAVVVVWSRDAVKSQWVRAEAEIAREAGTLVQLSLDGAALPLPFNRIQCADLSAWDGGPDAPGWRKVLDSVRDLAGAPPPRAPGAEPAPTASHASHAGGGREPLLAVLAFDNLSGDADMAWFSDGVSEEILHTVARGADLKVIGRASSFQFRGAAKAAANVAAQLGVTHVLDGSVRRSGTHLRIAADLIECRRETTLWSDRFDRELSDVFALQDEIAAAVAARLKTMFARPSTATGAVDPAAYDLYLQARARTAGGIIDSEDIAAVIETLEEATALAPTFARAWADLASHQAWSARFVQRGASQRAAATRAAQTALKLDPSLGVAWCALSLVQPVAAYAAREALLEQALAASPGDPEVLTRLGYFCAEVGRTREAADYALRARTLDPAYAQAANWYASTLDSLGRHDETRPLWDEFLARWPDSVPILYNAVGEAGESGDWARFETLAARLKPAPGSELRDLVPYFRILRAGDPHLIDLVVERARGVVAETGGVPPNMLVALTRLGRLEQAYELAGQSAYAYLFDPDGATPSGTTLGSLFRANARELRADPRFIPLCARLGLCDYWAATDRWPDCADEPPYDFRAAVKGAAKAA